jgi:hypothetical protein
MSRLIASFIAAGCLYALAASSSSIGFVHSTGDFRVDGANIRGNSTLFDGNMIETAAARSVIQLTGAQLTLAPESRAKVFSGRTVLEKGTGILRDTETHVLEAASLRISPAAKDSVVQVDLLAVSRISVFAVNGSALVRNSAGVLLGRLNAGMALAFDTPGAGGSTALVITGTVTLRDGHCFLTDTTTNVTVELRGGEIDQYVGKSVEVTGSVIPNASPARGAAEVAQVTGIRILNKTRKAVAAGTSKVAKATIIGGTAVVGTVGGLAAAGTFTGAPPTSAK